MLRIKRILAPIDFSAPSRQALAHARELAATYRAELDVLHVIEEPTFPAMYGAAMQELYGQVPDLNQQALDALQRVLAEASGPDVETGLHVQKGRAGNEIVEVAENLEADLIVLASHGLTGLQHLLLGSVAEKVVREAPCPVFVLKAFGKSLLEGAEATPAEDAADDR